MAEAGLLYKNQVFLLAQTFFILDNREELLLNAHKYDFDILFFDQMTDFVDAVSRADEHALFLIDLDVLYNMQADMQQQKRQTMFLSDLLQRLPAGHEYIYLQTNRQGERFVLQQRLVDSKCLAYAEKPITNENLVDKLFNIFARKQSGSSNTILYLDDQQALDTALLASHDIQVIQHTDATTLHLRVKALQPDIVLISEAKYLQTEAVARILKKNIEFDSGREIFLLQESNQSRVARQALDGGFDQILSRTEPDILTRQLVHRIQKIRTAKDLISRDRATGLLNKVGLQKRAQDWIQKAQQQGKPLAYGVIDIDKFKTINDTWGHYFGDIVIKRLSLVLSAYIGENDLLSRFGGEEFVMVFWDCDAQTGKQRMDMMREAFGRVVFQVTPEETRQFSFSGGLATFPECKSENELFLRADEQLYQAKQNGRNQICG